MSFVNHGMLGMYAFTGPRTWQTFANSSNSSASTITLPSDVQSDDLIVLVQVGNAGSNPPAVVTPSGYTALGSGSSSNTNQQIAACYKVSTGGDASAVLTGIAGGTGNRKVAMIFRPTPRTTVGVSNGSVIAGSTSGNPGATVIDSGNVSTPVIAISGWACETSAPTGTFSPTEDATLNGAATGALNLQVKYKIMNYNPANVTADMNDLSLNSTISFYMAMA